MLNNDDLKWIAATSTELNGFNKRRATSIWPVNAKGGENLNALWQIELASRASQSIFDRVTTRILTTNRLAGSAPANRSGDDIIIDAPS